MSKRKKPFWKSVLGFALVTILVIATGLALLITTFEIPRDDSLISKREWQSRIDAGPMPERYANEKPLDPEEVEDRLTRQQQVLNGEAVKRREKQILFGDTHVHTTFSQDAYASMLPVANGFIGAFPPADACDYARYIAQIDFFFLTDHAKAYTPKAWKDAINSVRDCNDIAGDPNNPDLVAFMGYEWTQVASTAREHYGHHNVLYKDTDDANLPPRPVSALRVIQGTNERILPKKPPLALQFLDYRNYDFYQKHGEYTEAMRIVPLCPEGIHTKELPENCLEYARTPLELYRKIDEFGVEAIVVPHGMAWGRSAAPGVTWEKYLDEGQVNNKVVPLLEIYSGHGNSEEYRSFSEWKIAEDGSILCPETRVDFYPGCRRAGDIINERCLTEGRAGDVCEQRAEKARQDFVNVPTNLGWLSVPGSNPDDWLDSSQCRDCFLPAYSYRPKKSAQYGLALRRNNVPKGDNRFLWGFVGSTDTHRAAAGNGFKQKHRLPTTDADGYPELFREQNNQKRGEPMSLSREVNSELVLQVAAGRQDNERLTSFLTLGGLAAVHSEGRDRNSIWDGLKRRETYATSGHRILLWFNMIEGEIEHPMGSLLETKETPLFQVSAAGSFEQVPGCPAHIKDKIPAELIQRLGLGECYYPSDKRRKITRIEVIRIYPQIRDDEPVDQLIEDVWKTIPCEDEGEGCSVKFSDPDFTTRKRDAVYYVRAIEEPTPTINGANLRARFDADGNVVSMNPCYGDERTAATDDCLEDVEHRAWSSPIFVDYSAKADQ